MNESTAALFSTPEGKILWLRWLQAAFRRAPSVLSRWLNVYGQHPAPQEVNRDITVIPAGVQRKQTRHELCAGC
jgi:hypothetical protein